MSAPELAPAGGWAGPAVPRIATPLVSERGLVFRLMSLFSRRLGRAEIPDVFSVFHINARLFWAWLFFASRLFPFGRLRAAERELVILRTAWNCRSRYEWGQHVEIGLRVGLSDAEVMRIAQGPQAFAGDARQALMQACDELFRDRVLSDGTWNALAERYDQRRLIEIAILAGHYIMLAGFLNSAGLRLEAPTEAKLQEFHRRVAATRQVP